MIPKTALICGISGQDGGLLARFLLLKGYVIWGTGRDVDPARLSNLESLNVPLSKINLKRLNPSNFKEVFDLLSLIKPDEIYFLGSQSSVSLSFDKPLETTSSIVSGAMNILESIRVLGLRSKFFNPSSSECFGSLKNGPADESTPFRPVSPYGAAKAAAHQLVINYRNIYQIFACNGILFNHESSFRSSRFVTKKIVVAASAIAAGNNEKLKLGRLDIVRDWGWAPEYVEAMWLMLQYQIPDDYVVATGQPNSLQSFVESVFLKYGLDWREHVIYEKSFTRPADIDCIYGSPKKIKQILGWQASCDFQKMVGILVDEHNYFLSNHK